MLLYVLEPVLIKDIKKVPKIWSMIMQNMVIMLQDSEECTWSMEYIEQEALQGQNFPTDLISLYNTS